LNRGYIEYLKVQFLEKARKDLMSIATAGDAERPETLVAYAARRVKAALASGEIPAGARLSPSKLAKDLDLSHIPVREALSALVGTGYIVHRGGRGYFARELSLDDLDDIYSLRELLEKEAYRRGVPRLTDDDIAELTRLVDEMAKTVAPEHRDRYLELNRQFHFIPFHRSGSERLVQFLSNLWDAAEPYTSVGKVDSTKGNEEHAAMLIALSSRDARAVVKAMGHHRNIRRERFEDWKKTQ
jgi:DNA-binding GntR family transcriptional regulator